MADINIATRHLNDQKRVAEAVVMTVPAIAQENGGRLSAPPIYYQYGDNLIGPQCGPNTIIKSAILVVREPFPTGTTVSVTFGGTALFTDTVVDAKAIVVSTVENLYVEIGGTLEATLSGGTGDITVGELEVILDVISANLTSGSYNY